MLLLLPKQSNLALILSLTIGLAIFLPPDAARAAARRRASSAPARSAPSPLALPANPTPLDYNNRAVYEGQHGMWDAAVHDHEKAVEGDPYNVTFRMNLSGAYLGYGRDLMNKRNFQQAIQKFHMALYVDQNNIAALEACSTCWKALGKNADDPAVRRELGETYEQQGDYPEAIAEYRQWVRIADSGMAHAALGRALVKQGASVPARNVEGFNELRVALSKDWPKDQQMELGRCHMQLADLLMEVAHKARDRNSGAEYMKRLANAAIEYRRAATIFNTQNLEAARGLKECALEAVSISPRSFENHLMLAGAYQLTGDFERAKKEYEVCWQLKPTDPRLIAARKSYHFAVVTAPANMVSPMLVAASVQKVEDSLRQNSNDAEYLYIYGRGKDTLGDHEVAMKAYQAAAAINPYLNADLPKRLGMTPPGTQVATTGGAPGPAGAGAPRGATGAPQGGAAGALTPDKAAPAASTPVNQNAAALDAIQSKLNSNDLDGALKDLTSLAEKDPKDGKIWFLMGKVDEKKGEVDDAMVAYRQASYLNVPEAAAALKSMEGTRVAPLLSAADQAISSKDLSTARDKLSQAESIMPNDSAIKRKLASIYKQLGDDKEAQRELQRADQIDHPIAKDINPAYR